MTSSFGGLCQILGDEEWSRKSISWAEGIVRIVRGNGDWNLLELIKEWQAT
jgi:hypothetical protein